MKVSNSQGSSFSQFGSLRARASTHAFSEINVTPLVDVMLVLLIVFMISAPMMQQGLEVELPKANTGVLDEVPDRLVLTIKRNHQVFLGEHALAKGSLLEKLQAISVAKPDIEVLVQADQKLDYGYLAEVIAEVKNAGIHRVGLVTEPSEGNKRI